MKKKSFSLQKLPEISKQKKEKLNEKNAHFEEKLKGIQRLQMHNELMSLKLKPYETTKSFKRQPDIKSEERAHKIVKILTKHQKFVQLEPIREIQYQSNKKIMNSTVAFKTPSKKMDVDGYLKEKNDRLIEVQLKQVQIQNSRRQYLPSIVQSQKKTFPYYSQSSKKYEEQPFIKLEEKGEKLQIRFLNGFQKWISKSNLKQVHQYQTLTLQSYRKTVKNIKSNEISLFDIPQNKQIIQKINIDSIFLNKMLNQVYNKKNPRQQIKILLKEQLYYNYEESVKQFNKMFVERRQIKRINRFQRKNKVSDELKSFIDHHLVCSYNLDFLTDYMLNKTHYIIPMVESYNIVGKLERFQHFNKLYLINNSPKFIEESILSLQVTKYFKQQKDKIENIIYSLQEHLNVLIKLLYKDIQHIIFLNPRLVGSNYQKDVKIFIASFSEHLSRIIRSVLIHAINSQLEALTNFYKEYSAIKKHSYQCLDAPTSTFYSEISGINEPIFNQMLNDKIIHGPGVIPIVFTLKKWKRKRYNNIYKFIIESRKNIRNFNAKQWRSFKNQEERIIFKDPLELLQSIIIKPLQQYLKIIHASQNVNGCIYNKKIQLIDFINFQRFQKEMMKIYMSQKQEKVQMYATYFELWELYYMEKPYIDDFIQLYKSIKAIKLIEEEMGYLRSDLQLIRSIPKIIEIHFIRLDISEIKQKIETTIITFMKKILKTCEQTLGKMLEYGYQQTIKAKKLNEVTPYTNLAQYINFINFLNQRQVEKSIQKIAQNVVFIDLNMSFLQKNQYEIKFNLMQRYLQSGTWIKKIRASATENKQKTVVDPFVFLKGVKDKRTKIFVKYNKMLKEIIQLMKVSELKNAMKLSMIAKNIAHQMKQICVAADEIVRQQTLLELEYAPQDPANIDEETVYRTDLTFFYKQQRFLKKYLLFWTYFAKLRSIIDNINDRRILDVDGVDFVRLLRQGQELITNIKISTLNKRFLHLCDQVLHQIQPFLKSSKLFLFLTVGNQNYRVRVIKQLTGQSSSQQMNVDPYNLTVRQLMALPLYTLDWHNIYKIKEDEQNYEACRIKLNSIYMVIKNLEINIKALKGIGHMKEYQLIVIDEETIKILKKCLQIIKITEQKYGQIFKNRQNQEDLLGQISKKINIFYRSLVKLKVVSEKLQKLYPIFQLVYPMISSAFEDLNLSPFIVAFENIIVDMSKKADLAKKLTFVTFFDDKVRISYDEDLKKLQQFQIKFYKEIIDHFHNNTYYGNSSLEKQLIFGAFSSLDTLNPEQFNKIACKLMGQWCKNVNFRFQYENEYYIVLSEFQTIHKQKIKLDKRYKLFEVNKFIENEAQKIQIKCGLLLIIESINKQLEKKIQDQTFQIFKLIYEYHYNLKNIFHFYLNINNLHLQSVIDAMMIIFHLDLSILYENKYDLNLLLTIIQQNKTCNPKEKDNQIITEALIGVMDEFITIINILQEKQYCLQDIQKGRIKKLYAYHSIPRLVIENINIDQCRFWIDEIKQEKQDDFINCMHLNPSLNHLNLTALDISKVEIKEIQKKQLINNFHEELNVAHMIVASHSTKQTHKHKIQKNRIKIVANIAPQLHLQDKITPFKFQIIKKQSSTQYIFENYRATLLLIQARTNNKVFITNIHPNYQLLGRNFLKVSNFIPNYNKNMAIIVHSSKQLLACLKSIVSYERHKVNKFIYIYYDKLNHEEIQTEQVDEHAIVFQSKLKLQINNLLKKELNYNQRQIFTNFIVTQSHFEACHPFADYHQKIISPNLLKYAIDGKQKQLLTGLIYSYQNHHGLSAEVPQETLLMISQPIYAISNSHFLMNYYFDLGQYIYTKVLKIASNDLSKQITNNLVNTLIHPEQHALATYVLPIYDFSHEELFTTIQYKSFDQKTFDRYDKEVFYINKIFKPYFSKGILHELIAFLSGQETLSEKWNQFKLKGFSDANVKWFVIDISEESPVCNEVFQFFMQSFSNNQYVFQDGSHYCADFHYNQKTVKDHKHKLIFIIHPNQLNQYKKDFPPIPIINQTLKFDPLKEFKIFLSSLSSQFPEGFIELVRIPDLLDVFKQILGCINFQELSIQSIETFKNIFYMMINEVRKREIALGHYNQSSLSIEESKSNLYGSIDLRQKNKLHQQSLLELQQIQKKMDLTRREVHKIYNQNLKYEPLLTKEASQRLQNQFNILNPTSYNKEEINQILKSSLIFSFYYSMILSCPNKKIQISKSLEAISNRSEMYHYCFSIQANKWERWEEIDVNLTFQSCSSSTNDKTLHSKEILRHNLSKFKMQALRDFTQEMDTLHNKQRPLIQMKGPQIFFMKLFILYNFSFKLTLPQSSYPTWIYEYELSLLKKPVAYLNEPLRDLSESKNKKILKFLNALKLKDMMLQEVTIEDKNSLIPWKSAINFKIIRNGEQWYPMQNTSIYFVSTSKSKHDQLDKIKLLKTHILVQDEQFQKNMYKLLTMIYNQNRFQMLQSQLDNSIFSLKTYHNRLQFLEHFKFRQYVLKGLSNQQLQEIYGLKLVITQPEKYYECRKKIKDIVNKIKMQQNDNKQELTIEQLEKLKTFDRISEINQVMAKIVFCVDIQRSEISKKFIIRYLLKRPRKYERIQSPQVVITKKRLKSPLKVQFDDVLYYDENYDRSNILMEEISQIVLYFNLNQRLLLVQNTGLFDPNTIKRYILGYKVYKRAIQLMLGNKSTKPFSVDIHGLENYEVNTKVIEIFNKNSLQIIRQELKDPAKEKMRIITVYNLYVIDELVEIFTQNLIQNVQSPNNHYYIIFTPKLKLNYSHGYRTIIENAQNDSNYLTMIRQEKIKRFVTEIEEFIKNRSLQELQKCNIGQSYIPTAIEKMGDIKIYTSNVKNDLISKKDVFDKVTEDIISASKNIESYKNNIEQNEKNIKLMESSLGFWKLKKEFYIGTNEFKQVNRQIKQYQRKRLQKQLNKPQYIQDNSYNISYIYTFNILADNNYFPDKTLPLLDQEYELNKSYQILEDQKKLFQKHFNYGRLNAIIDNDQLVFTDGLIQQDHLVMSNKVRNKFIYLRHVNEQIIQEKYYSKQSPFSLSHILKEELSYIHKHKGSECEQIFNKYITYLATHKYIIFIIAKTIETTEQQLKKARESIIKMKEMIEHQQLKYSSNKTYLEQIKSKYEIIQRELETCKKNQELFIQSTNQNVLQISSLFFKQFIGINIEYNFNFANRIDNEQIKRRQGKKDQSKKSKVIEEQNMQYKSQGIIKQISSKQILITLGEYVIDEMILPQRRSLNEKEKQFLITILTREVIEEIVSTNHIETIDELYEQLLVYLIKQLFPNEHEIYKEKNQQQIYCHLDYRKYNIISLQKIYQSNTHYFCKEIEANYKFQIKGLINRLAHKKQILNTTLLKFTEKIGLIQAKSSESILRFLLQNETLMSIEEYLQNSLKTITNTTTENMYYDGEWMTKNKQKWFYFMQVIEKIKTKLKKIYKDAYNSHLELYYIKLIGMLGKKMSLDNLDFMIDQIHYDHTLTKYTSPKQIKEKILQKRLQKKQNENDDGVKTEIKFDNQISCISTLDSILGTSMNLIIVHGSSLLPKILLIKALRSNKILKKKQQILYYVEQNTSKEYWILINISHQTKMEELLEKINTLKYDLALSQENHMKFILFFQSNTWKRSELKQIQYSIQPIYRFFYSNSPISIYYHCSFIFQQYSQRTRNTEMVAIFNIAKYYCNEVTYIPLYHIPLSALEKPQLNELLENLFDQFDYPSQSLYFRIVSSLSVNYEEISELAAQKLLKVDKEVSPQYIFFWPDEPRFSQISQTSTTIEHDDQNQSLIYRWMMKIINRIHKQNYLKADKMKNVSFSQLMKPTRDDMGFLTNQIENALSNPYKFIIINNCFGKLIDKVITKRHKNNNPMYHNVKQSSNNKESTHEIHQLLQITNKKQLFLEILHGANTYGLKLNNITIQISQKEASGSIGVFFKIIGTTEEWLNNIFSGELYMTVTDKKHKNHNELNYVKGVFFKYSQPIIYVKKQVEFGEEDTNAMRPLPQFKNLLSIYTSKNQYIGIIQLTTNQQFTVTSTLIIQLKD